MARFVQELYNDTLDLDANTNDVSYPFKFWKRDAYRALKHYARRARELQSDKDFYVSSERIEIVPHCTVKEGMEGYFGEYSKPSDMAEFIRMEIATCGTNWQKAEKEDLNTHSCGSENYDELCNNCKICRNPCLPTFDFENDLIVLKWIPQRTGAMKIWYYRTPEEISDDEQATLDFDEEFADLIPLRCALYYMTVRHEGQYGQLAVAGVAAQIQELERDMDRAYKRKHGVDDVAIVIPTLKT